MIRELSNKIIYNDFIEKTFLTEDESVALQMMLAKYSVVKMAEKMSMSDRNVSRIIREVKAKYSNYKKIEVAKLGVFKS